MGWPFVWFRLFWPSKINERPHGSGFKSSKIPYAFINMALDQTYNSAISRAAAKSANRAITP